MRLFVGVPLASALVEELSALSLRLQSQEDGMRWTSPESWHITLQFLGNTAEYDCIVARLHELRSPPVAIQLDGLGFFDRAGVFFAGVAVSEELTLLQQRVAAATGGCGFVPETRPYHPHITLARNKSKSVGPLRELKARIHREPKFSGFVAEEFVLYESHLRSTGSRYEVRERFPLKLA
ncbi:MAG TPA: RNA 2',3'-cyclic phosphodiesterase [Acidobacteriaceae bacterium]|nr:RNA 2',3'-cyclic phosphodiesterase [Acidobacteriaceae bacterium]